MNRRIASFLALVLLLGLTAATWTLLDDGAAAGVLGVAAAKSVVIGLVFLELDRAHPRWLLLGLALVAGLTGGVLALLP